MLYKVAICISLNCLINGCICKFWGSAKTEFTVSLFFLNNRFNLCYVTDRNCTGNLCSRCIFSLPAHLMSTWKATNGVSHLTLLKMQINFRNVFYFVFSHVSAVDCFKDVKLWNWAMNLLTLFDVVPKLNHKRTHTLCRVPKLSHKLAHCDVVPEVGHKLTLRLWRSA